MITHHYVDSRPRAPARGIAGLPPSFPEWGRPARTGSSLSSPPYLLNIRMVSFRLPGVGQVGSVLLQATLWLLAAGLRGIRGCSTRRPPPLRGRRTESGPQPGSQPHDPGRDPVRELLAGALAPRRLAAYARTPPPDGCQGRLRMAEESDQLSRWIRLSCYVVQDDVSRLLQAWVVKARPDPQDLACFSRRIVSERSWQGHCAMPELLLLSDVVATISHLVRSGRPLYDSLEELAQVSHLLARWHMPDHLRTRQNSTTWLQWVAVAVPALWLTLLLAMKLRGGTSRTGRAKRGARFLHPLVQLALGQGAGADPRTRRTLARETALWNFMVR